MVSRWEPDRAEMRATRVRYTVPFLVTTARMVETEAAVNLAKHTKYGTGRTAAELDSYGPYDEGADTLSMQVGSDAPGGWFLQTGARPHEILPHGPYYLRFFWDRVGREVFLSRVNHPGMKKDGWLTKALRRVARMRGFKVETYQQDV